MRTFGCNVTCEGIYADVQWTDGALGEKSCNKPSKRTKNRNGKDMGTMKMLKLISEYKEFKRNAVQHFRFDSASRSQTFGKMLINVYIVLNLLTCRGGNITFDTSTGTDLL